MPRSLIDFILIICLIFDKNVHDVELDTINLPILSINLSGVFRGGDMGVRTPPIGRILTKFVSYNHFKIVRNLFCCLLPFIPPQIFRIRVEQIDGGFFERYGSGFKHNFEEDTIIAEKDKFATLNEREISIVDNDIAERTQLSYKELLSSLLELNAKTKNEILKRLNNLTQENTKSYSKHMWCFQHTNHSSWIHVKYDIADLFLIRHMGVKKEEMQRRNENQIQFMTINELYEEVLHEILHCVGMEKNCLNQENIIEFARKAFKIEQDTHEAIYKAVIEKECYAKKAPNIMLNIEIIEGKDIKPKDANGFSDPFCTLFLSSTQQHRYNTSVKSQTLRPVWEEHFSLPVETPADDILCVEVWDFDPAETVKEKVTKVGDIKGFKGMRRFMKEIAVTATNGKHDNEIIGGTLIPLKTIPSRGQIAWYSLEKKGKGKPQGNLLLKLSFGSEKNKQVAAQEHRHLLRVLLAYQMNVQKPEMNSWKGDFLPESSLIIQQHVAQSNIGAVDECLSQWIEYINAHVLSPVVNFKVFSDILDILVKSIITGHLSNEELKMFWQSSKKILPFCFNAIRTIRKKSAEDEQLLNQIENVLNILQNLTLLELPNDLDLFPSDVYGWLLPCEHTRDIKSTLHDAVVHGAVDWHVHILENNKPDDFTDEGQMKLQLKIIQLLKLDLQRAVEFHNKKMQFPYVSTLFSIYESKISEMCEPFITRICVNMKPINFEENGRFQVDNDPLAMGTSLFELYMGIQKFVDLGKNNCNVDFETNSHLVKYHLWFQQGVARWLDIAAYKAMQRIERAVDLDKLVKVDISVEYSSSAVDTLAIFYQIKVFWQQLAWPDAEGSYSFVAKIIDDICRCSVYFSDKTAYKVNSTVIENKRFEVTKEVIN
ncbi:hypothetical protein AGLY_011876 [Aphis glycines]|uniref:C2 domain-containing protein n=1 Tax=Aphis glycines TaxID=307491 RepID=A0A6G0TDN8_APHGL|nr:hypothetical protein AGLY_011876 [Aphis glycines]